MNNKISLEFEAKLEKAVQAMKTASSTVKVMSNEVRATQTSFKSASNQLSMFSSYNKQLKGNLESISKTLKNYRTALTKLENAEAKGANKQLQINAISKYKEAISVLVKEQAKQQAQLMANAKIEEEYKNAGVKNSQELIEQKQKEKQAEKDLKNEAKKKAREEKQAEKEKKQAAKDALEIERLEQEKIKDTKENLKELISTIKEVGKGFKEGFEAPIKLIGKAINKIKSSFASIIPNFKNLGASLKSKFIDKAIDYTEELNLFNVVFKNLEKDGETTFSKIGKKATQFQNKLHETFGTNKMETMRYQGLYQSMSQSAGLSEDTAYIISESMTKLGYDLASLFNTTEKKAMESLRAGVFAGQTKPLRGYGIDVTQQTYKPVLADLGIDKKVSELSQAEKEVLRYIVTIKQATAAQGDFADTIESPANQLKVLKNQLVELSVAIGNYFIAPFQRALQVINGVIMALKALIDFFAKIFGIQIQQFNQGFSYNGEYEDEANDIDDIGESASGATKKIKELQRQVLGFDQINNLTTPTDTGSSGGSGTTGGNYGIDERLLNALEGYDSFMDKVKMKAVEIRDLIMSWLGFNKKIDPVTEETYFDYDSEGKSTREMVREMAQNLATELNKLIDDIDWEGLGRKLGYKITIVLTGLNQFIQTFDWKNLGSSIATYLNGVISEIDPVELGQTLTDKFRVAILAFSGFVQTFDFEQFANKLAKTINSAIENIPVDELINGINALVNGIFNTIVILMKKVKWKELVKNIVKILKNLDWKVYLLLLAPALAGGIKALITSSIVKSAITESLSKAIINLGGEGGLAGIFTAAKSAATKLLPVLGKVSVALLGIIGVKNGSENSSDLTYDIAQGKTTDNWEITKKAAGNALMSVGGGALAGAVIGGPLGAGIGAVVGGINAIVAEIKGYKEGLEDLAYSNLFGDLSVSQEEWTEKIQNSITPIEDLSTKFQDLQNKLNTLSGEYQGHSEQLDLLALKFSVSGEKISKEDGQAFLGAIQGIADSSKQIIQETGDYNLQIMSGIFENSSVMTEEEEKNILSKIYNANEDKKKEIDDAQNKITKIYNNGIKKRGYLTDEEYAEIQKQLKKIKDLVNSEMSKNQTDIEYFKEQAKNKNLKLDEDSYAAFNKALDNYQKEQLDKIAENYNLQYKTMIGNKDAWVGKEEEYNKILAGLGDERRKAEEQLNDDIAKAQKDVYQGLADEYVKVKDKNDGVSQEMKKQIEGIFKNINVDSSEIESQFASIGAKVGAACRKNIASELNKSNINYKLIPTKKQQEELGLKSSYLIPSKITGYANGGFPKSGQFFFANEAGPEMVGRIGNRTAVANNDQIVTAIRSGVYDAVSNAMKNSGFGSVDIQLHADEGVIVDRINKITRQTGTCPINI